METDPPFFHAWAAAHGGQGEPGGRGGVTRGAIKPITSAFSSAAPAKHLDVCDAAMMDRLSSPMYGRGRGSSRHPLKRSDDRSRFHDTGCCCLFVSPTVCQFFDNQSRAFHIDAELFSCQCRSRTLCFFFSPFIFSLHPI